MSVDKVNKLKWTATTTATKCNCVIILQKQQQQQLHNNCMQWHKSRKKSPPPSSILSATSSQQQQHCCTTVTSTTTNYANYYKFKQINNNNNNKLNTLLITTTMLQLPPPPPTMPNKTSKTKATALQSSSQLTLLLLMLITLTANCLNVVSAHPSPSAAAAAAPSFFLSPWSREKQQRQLQTQQLLASLKEGPLQRSNTATATATAFDETDDKLDDFIHANLARRGVKRVSAMETTGFVADDGQQYEKAARVLAEAAAAAAATNPSKSSQNKNLGSTIVNNNNNNNVDACLKSLTVHFDCAKRNLDRIPLLPNYVQIIDLMGNKLNDSTVLQIRNLAELHKLNLKRNQLTQMPIFTGLSSLKQLNLANNHIQLISSEALAVLPKLKSLDLSKNMLHTLESNYFASNNRLTHLLLNYNNIASIDENAFTSLGELLDLELNNNRIHTLPAGIFTNLTKLKKLFLNHNNLEIHWSTFKGLNSLQRLYLRSNNIKALQDGVFHRIRAIETIELDNNDITSLSRQGLFNLTMLQHLSLSHNSISRIEPDTWEFTQSLVSLDLSHNNISEFKPQHLDCLQRLKSLNLAHNKLQYLVDNTFDCVKNLEDLNLRKNRLAWIIEDGAAAPPFKSLRKLKKLDLYGNNLKQITSKSLSGLSNLESLNLGGNALASIQSGAFDHIQDLQKIIFKSMNFICDCDLIYFRTWLQKQANKQKQSMETNAVCGYPDDLFDKEVLTLTATELKCAPNHQSPKPEITSEPSNQLAVKGSNVTLHCIADSPAAAIVSASDELKIKWRHDNQNLRDHHRNNGASLSLPNLPLASHGQSHSNPSSSSHSTTETQIHHDKNTNQTTITGILRVYNMSYESAGRYQCVVTNAFGTTYSQKFKISIGIQPSFLEIPQNLTIDSGESARLVCSATGDPFPEMALTKFGGGDFSAATERRLQVIRDENAFIITNANPNDTGIYTCTAKSAAGMIKINATLVVNNKPQPDIPVIHKEIKQGGYSVLECISDLTFEMNEIHREWYKDNKPIHTESRSMADRYYFTNDKELLVILSSQSVDSGHYRCEITDKAKTYVLQTELIVVKEDLNQNIIIISVATLCLLVGSGIVLIFWYNQKRKQMLIGNGSLLCNGNGGLNAASSVIGRAVGGDVLHHGSHHLLAASQHALSSSRGSVLDQTQMTTLNRSYSHRSRPRSLMNELETNMNVNNGHPNPHEQSNLIVTPTPTYQQLLQRAAGVDEALTLEYIQQRHNSGLAAEDQLSSKDSGTGSDAAVKRSMDDFTLHMNEERTPPKRASLAQADTDDSDEPEDEAHLTYVNNHALGVSQYEVELDEGEKCRFLQNNNHNHNSSQPHDDYDDCMLRATREDDNDDISDNTSSSRPSEYLLGAASSNKRMHKLGIPTIKCKTQQHLSSTNFNGNAVLPNSQAVDI